MFVYLDPLGGVWKAEPRPRTYSLQAASAGVILNGPHETHALADEGPTIIPGTLFGGSKCAKFEVSGPMPLYPDPCKDRKSRSPNSGFWYSCGIDYRTQRGIYFVDPRRGLGNVSAQTMRNQQWICFLDVPRPYGQVPIQAGLWISTFVRV